MLWISWQARTQSPQERICLITNKFVIKTNAFFAAIASVLVMKFKAWSNWFRGRSNHGAWLDHESLLLILSWLRGLRPMCTRMSMDIRVHIGRNPRSQNWGISSKTLSTSSLINAPLIVKDEVDKVFELILFVTKQKFYVGLRLIVWDSASSRGPWRAPGQWSMITILIE